MGEQPVVFIVFFVIRTVCDKFSYPVVCLAHGDKRRSVSGLFYVNAVFISFDAPDSSVAEMILRYCVRHVAVFYEYRVVCEVPALIFRDYFIYNVFAVFRTGRRHYYSVYIFLWNLWK